MHMHLRPLLAQFTKPNQTLSSTRILHTVVIKNNLSSDPFYATKITRFYALNNDLISARNLFEETPQQSVYLWNSIIRAYARAHKFFDAFLLFKRLLISEIEPDNYTFACILRACSESFDFQGVKVVHGKMIASGLGLDYICNSSLVSCYSKLSLVAEASRAFLVIDEPDLVLWNAMISCYGSCGELAKGIELFNEMLKIGKRPDGYTIVGLMMGLTDQGLLKIGEVVHGFCVKCGLIMNDHVGSVLVCVYSRCKNIDLACSVFDSLLQPDLVTWSALITGFSQAGDHVSALIFFTKLLMGGASADSVLLASVLAASSQLAILEPGCEIHGYAVRHGRDSDVMVSSALIDMYAKCGFLESGIRVFRNMVDRNIVSYNSVISGLGLYGRPDEAFKVFEELLENELKPDEATFSGLLCACCHAGLVNEGRRYFKRMRDEFGIQAKTEHHVYMVKILGMNGQLREAYEFTKSLPEPVHCSVWGALLSCCDAHNTDNLPEVIADHVIENKWRNRGYDVMLSNLYAGKEKWNDVKQLRVDSGGVQGKIRGISWIGV
ncbi:putative pentatricopeptide repeat-containing protein At1g64310 [Henckelia pumila]|uniref:putative pentatricopeptide repeat-containing protein At1g64310 n=1 Tax=Henckelia pumila TaxID=405737 RepID=UPI003C6E5CE0